MPAGMLTNLLIENYALIHKLDASFGEGLTVITGETGAGKSILLGALSLILGERADTRVLGNKNRKCIIEGTFELSGLDSKELFLQQDLDYEESCLFRREISPKGKSRAFINDTPVRLPVMRHLAGQLIDIHSQHESLMIGRPSFQFDVLDAYAGQVDRLKEYRKDFRSYQALKKKLEETKEEAQKARANMDYYRFQLAELDKLQLDPAMHREMEAQAALLRNAEEVRLKLEKALYLLEDGEVNAGGLIHTVCKEIQALSPFGSSFPELSRRLDSVQIELRDIGNELRSQSQGIELDPEHAGKLEAALDELNRLMMKHQARSVEELGEVRRRFRERLEAGTSLGDAIDHLDMEVRESEERLGKLAWEISGTRRKAIPGFEKEIHRLLKDLAMPGARFRIEMEKQDSLGIHGQDHLRFLFNANPGGQLDDIGRLASGGEMSRVMLSIKSMVSQKQLLPTIIFDEIDTGISGETSNKLGQILEQMAHKMQVLAITHLPQIASRGRAHLEVFKDVIDHQTYTKVKELSHEERIITLASMLGGEKPSKAMLESAKELIFNKKINDLNQ